MVKTAYNNIRGDIIPAKINIIIYPDKDSGGYWAKSVNIPGAFTQGDTIQETEKNMYEAIDLLLEDDYDEIINYTLDFEVCDA